MRCTDNARLPRWQPRVLRMIDLAARRARDDAVDVEAHRERAIAEPESRLIVEVGAAARRPTAPPGMTFCPRTCPLPCSSITMRITGPFR